MKKTIIGVIIVLIAVIATVSINRTTKPVDEVHSGDASGVEVAGYLYTSLNGENTNKVVSFERNADGSLGEQKAYSTKSKGGANVSVGGDARGDFDSQGAIQIIDDKLLVVNAGGNTVSVFDVNKENGTLEHKRNVDSEGTRPVSLTYLAKDGVDNEYWVVVGNQWNNPNVQKGGEGEGPVEMYPNAEWHAENGPHTEVLEDRNIALFSFNTVSGDLSFEKTLDTYNGTNGGPTTVNFNKDGSKLAVATWGIAHFGTATPTYQQPSRVYVYDFDNGSVSGDRYFEEKGIAGSIGFEWDKNNDNLFVSNFNLAVDKHNNGLTVLKDNGNAVTKVAGFGTGNGDDIDEACWVALNPAGDKLYVSSFGGNIISTFDVARNGIVSKIGGGSETVYAEREANTPAGDTKDMYVSSNNKDLYVLGAYQTFTISRYDIANNGTLNLNTEYKVDAAKKTGAGIYNFLGLVGFDK